MAAEVFAAYLKNVWRRCRKENALAAIESVPTPASPAGSHVPDCSGCGCEAGKGKDCGA